jgi:NAD(P)H-hydrate repair Nnr-like enzyme with NAD(P)H-hydrate dehydratase domain
MVLKGSGTVVAGAHGAAYLDPVAAHDLATAGSGDVLSGLIGGFLAHRSARQGSSESARCVAAAVYVHGLAARLAARAPNGSTRPVVATDLVDHIAEAVATLRQPA